MKRILFILLLCSLSNSYPQRFVFGFRNEFALFVTNDVTYSKSSKKFTFGPMNITLSFLIKVNDNSGIDLRPGFSANRTFSGPELGIYFNQYVMRYFYIYAGGKAHLSMPDNPSNNTYTPLFLSLGIGYDVGKITSIEIVINHALKEKYANEKPEYIYSLNRTIDPIREIYYDLRLGIGIWMR